MSYSNTDCSIQKDVPSFLTFTEYPMMRALWEHCFPEDSAPFCEYYFSEKMKNSRAAVIKRDGKICSMLHLNRYLMQVFDHQFDCEYIVGVGTDTSCRRQGLMGKLLRFAFQTMYKEGQPLTFLMPASEKIYTPYDFVYIGEKTVSSFHNRPETKLIPVSNSSKDAQLCARLMNDWLAGYDVHTVRDETYVRNLLTELQSEQGELFFIVKDQADFASENALSPSPLGLFAEWGLEKRETRLLYGDASVVEKKNDGRLMMGRIIHAPAALQLFHAKSPVTVLLRLSDRYIPENNGVFLWTVSETDSIVKKLPDAEADNYKKTHSTGIIDVDIKALTDFLFGGTAGKTPVNEGIHTAAWELFSKIITVKNFFLDEVV